MGKVTDFLKKIGILKTWNAKGTYKNANERPDKFYEKDAYDASDAVDSDN